MLVRALLLWAVLAIGNSATTNSASKEKNVAPGSKGYVAEWQWEAWAPAVNASGGPGPRAGAALWLDRTADAWWLFGGRQPTTSSASSPAAAPPPKDYSDLWRYDPRTHSWTRVFPADGRRSGPKGMLLLRSSLQEQAANGGDASGDGGGGDGDGNADASGAAAGGESDASDGGGGGDDAAAGKMRTATEASPALLCGRADPQDPLKRSLSYYDPRNRRSNTVWQLELSDRVWTAYMCCCDRADAAPAAEAAARADTPPERAGTLKTHASSARPSPTVRHGVVRTHSEDLAAEAAADAEEEAEEEERREDEEEREEKEAAVKAVETSTRVVSVTTAAAIVGSSVPTHAIRTISSADTPAVTTPTPVHATVPTGTASPRPAPPGATTTPTNPAAHSSSTTNTATPTALPPPQKPSRDKTGSKTIRKPSENKSREPPMPCCDDDSSSEEERPMTASAAGDSASDSEAFCPDFETGEGGAGSQPVAWCDSAREQLLAMDLHTAPLALWQFDLASSHWSRHRVSVRNGTLWPGCASDPASIRYAGSGSSALVLCVPYGATGPTPTRLVYRLETAMGATKAKVSKSGKRGSGGAGGSRRGAVAWLRALGQLHLEPALANAALWADDSRSSLAAVPAGPRRTLLFMAHERTVSTWLVDESGAEPRVESIENVWRTPALKWFRSYSSPLYNMKVQGQTWMLPNPRSITQYWSSERGRFVVTLLTREEAARLVLADSAQAAARGDASGEAQGGGGGSIGGGGSGSGSHDGVKALIFFAFSLTIFAVFGVVLFVRRCVTCPGGRGRGGVGGAGGGGGSAWCGGRGSDVGKPIPPVIRYSVIPDDLAYARR